MNEITNKLIFYWITSYAIAVGTFIQLWMVMPRHYVFGIVIRMIPYHYMHPFSYILIPCFFYGILATLFYKKFQKGNVWTHLFWTLLIVLLTILLSSPFGGMLWHFHDMLHGYFPKKWFYKMLTEGFKWGLEGGWFIIAISIPYNIIGVVCCFFLNRAGPRFFEPK